MTRGTRSVQAAGYLLALVLVAAAPHAWGAEGVKIKPDDAARVLAGLEPRAGSPLAAVTRDPGWQQHARSLNGAWASLEERRLAKIRTWSAANLTEKQPVVLYMFSGPDFLYVDAFFPDRTTYVLAGLEPVGQPPLITEHSMRYLSPALAELRSSLGSVLNYSFFITQQMRAGLGAQRFSGVVPILYIFLARAGKTIHEVNLIAIDKEGAVVAAGTRDAAPAVKIEFSGSDGKMQTLYYVQTDLSDSGVRRSGFLKFCEQLGNADGFIKSASYLLHVESFSAIRNFLLARTSALVQDDSGIPVRFFSKEQWRLQPFGRYLGPINVFPNRYQSQLSEVYRRSNPPKLDFGVGYRWRPNESNLLLAVKTPK
jgi:hypothetical protein